MFGTFTFGVEDDLLHGSMKQHPEVLWVSSGEKICSGVAEAILVEDGAADLGAVDVVVGVSIERREAGLDQSIPQCSLPRRDVRPVNDPSFYPRVRFVHQLLVPASRLHEAGEQVAASD